MDKQTVIILAGVILMFAGCPFVGLIMIVIGIFAFE